MNQYQKFTLSAAAAATHQMLKGAKPERAIAMTILQVLAAAIVSGASTTKGLDMNTEPLSFEPPCPRFTKKSVAILTTQDKVDVLRKQLPEALILWCQGSRGVERIHIEFPSESNKKKALPSLRKTYPGKVISQ